MAHLPSSYLVPSLYIVAHFSSTYMYVLRSERVNEWKRPCLARACSTSARLRNYISRPSRSATETSSRIHKFPPRIRGTLRHGIPEIFSPKIFQKFVPHRRDVTSVFFHSPAGDRFTASDTVSSSNLVARPRVCCADVGDEDKYSTCFQ